MVFVYCLMKRNIMLYFFFEILFDWLEGFVKLCDDFVGGRIC